MPRTLAHLLAPIATASAVLALTFAAPRPGVGQGPQAASAKPEPGTLPKDLLKATPFDRITLVDNSVWLVEEVAPAPLPPYEPEKAKAAAKAKARKEGQDAAKAAKGAGVKRDLAKEKEEQQQREAEAEAAAEELIIHLVEGEIRDFKINRTSLKKIDYFEDLLLAEADRLIIAKDFAKAFEHFLRVKTRDPNWKGLAEKVDKFLFEEGAWGLVEQDRARGVRLLRELSARRPDYPDLADKLAVAYGGRITESFEKGQYPYARRILHDLETISPKNPLVANTRDKFAAKAKSLVDAGMQAEGPARLEKLTESLRVWPTAEGAAEKYAEAYKALPTLDVAVVDMPRPTGPFIRDPAGERVAKLLYLPLLANETEDATTGKIAEQLVTSMEVGDIGRRLDLKLKTGPVWSDGSRPVAAIDAVRALSDRAQPRSPGYSARWADLLERVEITDEQQVTIRLNRSILKPEAWLLGPVGPAHAAWDGRVPSPDGRRRPVGDGPFIAETESEGSATYRSANEKSGVQMIREVRYATGPAALGALVRGEVSLVEHVPPDRVGALQQDAEMKVGKYSRPSLHRIALDGRTPALRNRSIRRGMAYAIDRKGILEELVLRRPIDEANLPSDGPFAVDSYANAPGVAPIQHDMLLAKMLIGAGKAEIKMPTIKLTLEYPAIPEAQAAAPRIAESLKSAGIEVVLQERTESELEEAIRSGRKFDLAYRSSKCVEPVWEVGPMLCPGFDAPSVTDPLAAIASPRIMQLLLQLEHAQDWNTAKELVTQIDRECRDELPIIPLWQLEDHFAYRARLKGPAEVADHLYQGIEQWQIEPWFAKDPW